MVRWIRRCCGKVRKRPLERIAVADFEGEHQTLVVCFNFLLQIGKDRISKAALMRILSCFDGHLAETLDACPDPLDAAKSFVNEHENCECRPLLAARTSPVIERLVLIRALQNRDILVHVLRNDSAIDPNLDSLSAAYKIKRLIEFRRRNNKPIGTFRGARSIYWFSRTDDVGKTIDDPGSGTQAERIRDLLGLHRVIDGRMSAVLFELRGAENRHKTPTIFDAEFCPYFYCENRADDWGTCCELPSLVVRRARESVAAEMAWPTDFDLHALGLVRNASVPNKVDWIKYCSTLWDELRTDHESLAEDLIGILYPLEMLV